jgi:hypothetical protein
MTSFEQYISIKVNLFRESSSCDTEQFSDDSQEVMAQYGMGVLYEKKTNRCRGELLRNVTPELRNILTNTTETP